MLTVPSPATSRRDSLRFSPARAAVVARAIHALIAAVKLSFFITFLLSAPASATAGCERSPSGTAFLFAGTHPAGILARQRPAGPEPQPVARPKYRRSPRAGCPRRHDPPPGIVAKLELPAACLPP